MQYPWSLAPLDPEVSSSSLRESEDRFRQLAEHIDAVFWLYDVGEARTVYVSPPFQKIWGMAPEDLYQNPRAWVDALHPEEREAVLSTVRAARGEEHEIEYRIIRPDGEVRWIRDRSFPVQDDSGRVFRSAGIAEDITESKRMHAERAAAEAHYRRLVETTPQTIFALDAEGRIVELNPAGEELLGRAASDLMGHHFSELIDGRDLELARATFVRLMAGEQVKELEIQIRRPSGERRLVRTNVAAVDEDGAIVGAHGVARDITEERRAETALQVAHARLAQNQASSPTVLTTITIGADGSVKTLWVSDNVRSVLGYEVRDAMAPGWWFSGLHPEDLEGTSGSIATLLEAGILVEEFRFRHANGTYRWIHHELRLADDPDQPGLTAVGSWTDITQRKQSELVLQESEQSYRSLFDSLAELVFIVDLDGHLLNVNEALLARYGFSREEVIGATPALFGDPERLAAERLSQYFDKALHGQPQRFQFWSRTRSGERFPVEVSLVKGRYFGADVVVAVGQDITDRRLAEDALAAAEAHYRRLVENAPYAVYALDHQHRFTELSSAAREILGRDPAELIGRPFTDLVALEDLPLAAESLRRKLGGEAEISDLEVRLMHASGELRLVHVRASVVWENGQAIGTHGIARDITADRARHEQATLLAAALHGFDQGVTISDSDGQMIYANAAHGRLLGFDPESRPLPHISQFFAGSDGAQRLRDAFQVATEQGVWTGRVERRRVDDGRVIPLQMLIGRVERPDREPLLFAISRDITEDLKKEQHLRRVERLATVGTLVGGVAHELNNPLQAITNFAALLLDDARSAQERDDLETIQREAARAAKIVSDLRLLARSTQEIPAERDLVDLNEVARHVLKTRRYSIATHNIELREDLAADLPPVRAQRGEIEQVVLNLVVNAEQSMERTAEGRRLILRTRATDDGVALYVVDTGPGIAQEHLDRIFDPFFTTKPPGEGTGLGLSLVYNIISEHGGEVNVESELGKGSAFRIHLPRASAGESRAATGARPARVAVSPLRILVVDDEASIRNVLARYLTRRGHQVHVAAEGGEALRLVHAQKADQTYDAIVSDLRMPGLGGDQLLTRLKALGTGLDRRVIFLTGDAAAGDAARILAESDAPVIYKPVELEELALRIERRAQEVGGPLVPQEGQEG